MDQRFANETDEGDAMINSEKIEKIEGEMTPRENSIKKFTEIPVDGERTKQADKKDEHA